MKPAKLAPIPLLVSVALLGSASAGATTYLLGVGSGGSRTASPPSIETPTAGADAELRALLERVDALVQENRDLQMRLASLEGIPAPAARAPIDGFASKTEFEAFQKEVRGALASRESAVAEPAELKEQVAGALIDLRKEEAVNKVRDYQEKRDARLDEDIQKLTEWLALSPYQAQEMRGILTNQYEREAQVRRMWEDGVDDEFIGEQKRSAGETFKNDLGRALTPEQVTTFWERVANRGKN